MRLFILLTLACVPSLGCYSQATEKYRADDVQALNNVAQEWERSWNSHDMNALATLFANDVDFVTKSGTWFKGKEATMNHHKQNHATVFKNSTWTRDNVEIKYVKPDLAIIHIGWGMSGARGQDRGRAGQTGYLATVAEIVTGAPAARSTSLVAVWAMRRPTRPGQKPRVGTRGAPCGVRVERRGAPPRLPGTACAVVANGERPLTMFLMGGGQLRPAEPSSGARRSAWTSRCIPTAAVA
jgi:uncharacterized protein (TIGR02246 family)